MFIVSVESASGIWNILLILMLQGQYHLGLGGGYEGSEPSAPTATPADCWDATPLPEHHQLTPFNNSVTDSPTTPTSVNQYYMQQVRQEEGIISPLTVEMCQTFRGELSCRNEWACRIGTTISFRIELNNMWLRRLVIISEGAKRWQWSPPQVLWGGQEINMKMNIYFLPLFSHPVVYWASQQHVLFPDGGLSEECVITSDWRRYFLSLIYT